MAASSILYLLHKLQRQGHPAFQVTNLVEGQAVKRRFWRNVYVGWEAQAHPGRQRQYKPQYLFITSPLVKAKDLTLSVFGISDTNSHK